MLEHPIVVFVDYLDRLEPSEAAEVLRLVKVVVDFPNVAYILAYDPEVLALRTLYFAHRSDESFQYTRYDFRKVQQPFWCRRSSSNELLMQAGFLDKGGDEDGTSW